MADRTVPDRFLFAARTGHGNLFPQWVRETDGRTYWSFPPIIAPVVS